MRKLLISVFGMAASAMCAWTDPKPLVLAYYNVGCGTDAGKAILLADFSNTSSQSYVLKSDSPIFPQAAALIERSVADQIPVQFFTRLTGATVAFSYMGDGGTCVTKNWVEIIGVAIDKK